MKPDAPTDCGEGKDNCLFGLRFKLLIRIPDMMYKALVTVIFGILDRWLCGVSCAFFHDQNNQSVLILDKGDKVRWKQNIFGLDNTSLCRLVLGLPNIDCLTRLENFQ